MNKQDNKNKLDNNETQKDYIVTPGQLVLKRFMRNKLAIIGFFILIIMFIFSFIGPFILGYGEYQQFYQKDGVEVEISDKDGGTSVTEDGLLYLSKSPPSKKHILGTDKDGRDILTRLMYGGRVSLTVGFVVIVIQLLLGVTLGGIAGFYGGWIDNLIMRIVDIFNCIPTFPVMLIVSSALLVLKVPQDIKIYFLIGVIAVLGWASIARLVRGQILKLREQEYIVAAEAIGLRSVQKIFKHLVPNVMPQLIVIATLGMGSIILTEASLSFLGLGIPFPYASWGNMVDVVRDRIILVNNPNMWVPPGICILITVLGFNFVGDGLRDAYDPKMKR